MDEEHLLQLVKKSFYGVYYFMIFAFIITLISAFIVKDFQLQRILVVEILVTFISSVMYFIFTSNINQYFSVVHEKGDNIDLNLSLIDRLRYNGWTFTTPLMLIALCMVLSSSTKIGLNPILIFTILILDFIMLLLGYLGELHIMDRLTSMMLGFIPLLTIFYLIFSTYIINTINPFNYIIFFIYLVIWTGYGIVYWFDEKEKNILTNLFDAIAKGVVAILLSFSYLTW